MFGIKRRVYWCPDTEIDSEGRGGWHCTETGAYRCETTRNGVVISDNIHRDLTFDHYLPIWSAREVAYAAECAQLNELRAKNEADFISSAKSILSKDLNGIVAIIENTFENGYTSIWHYKVQDGQCFVQKPHGNQARAEFSSIEEMAQDFRRYLNYGFTVAG